MEAENEADKTRQQPSRDLSEQLRDNPMSLHVKRIVRYDRRKLNEFEITQVLYHLLCMLSSVGVLMIGVLFNVENKKARADSMERRSTRRPVSSSRGFVEDEDSVVVIDKFFINLQ